jgi:hypothetical protein
MARPTCVVCGFDSGGGPLCEAHRKAYSRVAYIIDERDRLAAENAELRKAVAETEQACSELSDELSHMHQLELEAKCHGDLEESHKIMVGMVAERDAELAAANATLDALRELCGSNKTISNSTCMKMVDLLYPRKSIK